MKTVKEMIGTDYVIVPVYSYQWGYHKVERFDMSNDEWKSWLKAKDLRQVKKIISEHVTKNTKAIDIKNGLQKIVDFLKSEGVDAALVNSMDCIDLRTKVYDTDV